ncbi:hypothetical protein HYDPIDRAFT_58535, partial [Hydnomerulius pinastri MD-312]
LQVRMNARALKTRLRDRLRQRKFEMDRVERSHCKTASGKCKQKLREHTEASVKRREPGILQLANNYNKLCIQMQALIRQKKAPRGAIAPLPIARDGLFKLDVDDDVWQDLGLGD